MLYIVYEDSSSDEWHVRTSLKEITKPVIGVSADGDELAYILENFSNIRKCKSLSITWFGDEAKFIACNLHLMNM